MMSINDLDLKIDSLKRLLDAEPLNIAVLSHTNPDGDSIGSSLAWAKVLTALNHNVHCLVPNRYPSFLSWMQGIDSIIIAKDNIPRAVDIIEHADVIFCLDFNRIDRFENLSDSITNNKNAVRVLIDHHLDPPADQFDIMFSDPACCSTSFLVYKITERFTGLDLFDKHAAESLYAGIMTDTGNFSYGSLTPDLFRAVAGLMEKGIDIPAINSRVYNAYSEGRVRLLGYSLDKMKVINNGTVAFITLRENELRRFNFQIGDSEGFVNYPLTIASVQMSAMFLETRKFIRISFRSRGNVDVSEFAARYFGGGGHKNASGGKSYDNMRDTVARFCNAVNEYFGITTAPAAE